MSSGRKRCIRNGHRTHVKKLIIDYDDLVNCTALDVTKVLAVQRSLMEKREVIKKKLDVEILDLTEDEDEIVKEIDETSVFSDIIIAALTAIEGKLAPIAETNQIQPDTSFNRSLTSESHNVRLPKLQIPSFDGNVLEYRGFWDQFSSSVASNNYLSDIDKFCYLRSVLKGPALELRVAVWKQTDINNKAFGCIGDVTTSYGY